MFILNHESPANFLQRLWSTITAKFVKEGAFRKELPLLSYVYKRDNCNYNITAYLEYEQWSFKNLNFKRKAYIAYQVTSVGNYPLRYNTFTLPKHLKSTADNVVDYWLTLIHEESNGNNICLSK